MSSDVQMVLLGWVLGVFTTWITDAVKDWKTRTETGKGIQTELNELRLKLLASIYLLRCHLGTFDRKLLNWMTPLVAKYEGAQEILPIVKVLNELSGFDDAAFYAAVATKRQIAPQHGLTLKKYAVPYLEAKMDQLGSLSGETQSTLLSIKGYLELLNQEIDLARHYTDKTFAPNLSEENHASILLNVRNRYQYAAEGAETIVNLINKMDQIRNGEQQ